MSWTAAPTTKRRLTRRAAPNSTSPTLSEVFAGHVADASAVGFVLSRLPAGQGPVLWVQDRVSAKESGVVYMPAMPDVSLLRVAVNRPVDALWALEEGLRCGGLRAVIGEIWGDPPALSFTATKRLAMRAEASGVPCWLMRRAAQANLSAARDRWRVSALPSTRLPDDSHAPGGARWQVDLFRSRHAPPGKWVAAHDPATGRVDLRAGAADAALDAGDVGRRASSA